MPKLIRLYLHSIAVSFALSSGFLAAVVLGDVAGLGQLILGSSQGGIAAAMLVMFFGVLFSSIQFGLRIMMLAESGDTPRGGLRQRNEMIPVRVEVIAPRRGPARRR